jgi:hypothetical protein
MIQDVIKNVKGIFRNPLGIITLLISLIYGFACLVLTTSLKSLIGNEERIPLIWFVIGFPILIILSFFLHLLFDHQKLYAPIDYKGENNFVASLRSNGFRMSTEVDIILTENTKKNKKAFDQLVKKIENPNYNKELFPIEAKPKLKLANLFLDKLRQYTDEKATKGIISGFGFGIQAPEYFLISYYVPEKYLKQKGQNYRDTVIIRVTENSKDELCLIAIGKDIEDNSVDEFAKKFNIYIDEKLKNILKED